jgi:hypothetical protein
LLPAGRLNVAREELRAGSIHHTCRRQVGVVDVDVPIARLLLAETVPAWACVQLFGVLLAQVSSVLPMVDIAIGIDA